MSILKPRYVLYTKSVKAPNSMLFLNSFPLECVLHAYSLVLLNRSVYCVRKGYFFLKVFGVILIHRRFAIVVTKTIEYNKSTI